MKKLVKEHINQLNELKSNDIFLEQKDLFKEMIIDIKSRFKLSTNIAVMMLAKAIKSAGNELD